MAAAAEEKSAKTEAAKVDTMISRKSSELKTKVSELQAKANAPPPPTLPPTESPATNELKSKVSELSVKASEADKQDQEKAHARVEEKQSKDSAQLSALQQARQSARVAEASRDAALARAKQAEQEAATVTAQEQVTLIRSLESWL